MGQNLSRKWESDEAGLEVDRPSSPLHTMYCVYIYIYMYNTYVRIYIYVDVYVCYHQNQN